MEGGGEEERIHEDRCVAQIQLYRSGSSIRGRKKIHAAAEAAAAARVTTERGQRPAGRRRLFISQKSISGLRRRRCDL